MEPIMAGAGQQPGVQLLPWGKVMGVEPVNSGNCDSAILPFDQEFLIPRYGSRSKWLFESLPGQLGCQP